MKSRKKQLLTNSKVTKTLLLRIKTINLKHFISATCVVFILFCSSYWFNFLIKIVSMEAAKKSTFKVLFYLKKNTPKKNGKVTVMCRITVNGKQSAFSTKLDISASNWDLKYGRVLGKSREGQEVNDKLYKIRLVLRNTIPKF